MSLDADPPHGPWYVAQRAAEPEPDEGGTARACTQCGEDVWIDEPVLALAESCSGVVCCDCTGTSHGILLIPTPASSA
jgi:hypothetical protein